MTPKMETVKEMSLRDDEQFLEMVDALALGNRKTAEMLLNHLFVEHWNSEIDSNKAIFVAVVDWLKHYAESREADMDIQTSLDLAIAHVLSNPNIQKLMADLMSKQLGSRFQ